MVPGRQSSEETEPSSLRKPAFPEGEGEVEDEEDTSDSVADPFPKPVPLASLAKRERGVVGKELDRRLSSHGFEIISLPFVERDSKVSKALSIEHRKKDFESPVPADSRCVCEDVDATLADLESQHSADH